MSHTGAAQRPLRGDNDAVTNDAVTDELLARFHDQIRLARREDEPAPGIVLDSDGPVVRRYPQTPGTSYAMVECPAGLGDDPDHCSPGAGRRGQPL